jgi:coenzyme F420-reducing hydrogenase delta subunit
MSNVIRFNGVTRLNVEPDIVLEAAIGALDGVVVLGYSKDGEEYFASSYADGGDVLWLLERLKKQLLEVQT